MKTRLHDGFVKVDRVETAAGPREVVVATDSVACLVYNKDTDELMFATQDGAPMMRPDNPKGTILGGGPRRFDTKTSVWGPAINSCPASTRKLSTERV